MRHISLTIKDFHFSLHIFRPRKSRIGPRSRNPRYRRPFAYQKNHRPKFPGIYFFFLLCFTTINHSKILNFSSIRTSQPFYNPTTQRSSTNLFSFASLLTSSSDPFIFSSIPLLFSFTPLSSSAIPYFSLYTCISFK